MTPELGKDYNIYRRPDIIHPQQLLAEELAMAYLKLAKDNGVDYVSGIVVGLNSTGTPNSYRWGILTLTTRDLLTDGSRGRDFFQLVDIESCLYTDPVFKDLPMYFFRECPSRVNRSPLDILQRLSPGSRFTTIIGIPGVPPMLRT